MALATRCPQCGTTFRVVRDQIKLREGWVRCGVCSTPFDSHASLIEIDLPTPAPADPPVAAQAPAAAPAPAPVMPDPIEDHPAVLRTRVPRAPIAASGEGEFAAPPAASGWPAAPAVWDAPGVSNVPEVASVPPQSGFGATPDFGTVPDLYPPAAPAGEWNRASEVTSPTPAAPMVPPAPFTPAAPFRTDTEAASAAHLRAVLAQSDKTSAGRSEPSFGYGDVPSDSHAPAFGPTGPTGLTDHDLDRSLDRHLDQDREPSFRQADASPPVNPALSGRLDPSLRPTEPMLRAAATAAAAAAAAAGTSSRPIEPTFSSSASAPPLADAGRRQTEPTFGAAPVPRDDREPRFVTSHDDDADADGGVDRNRDRSDDDIDEDDHDHDRHTASTAYASDAATPGSPGFLSDADDASASRMHAVWIALAIFAAIVLLVQSIWLYRTELATWFPSLRPALEKACGPLKCTVGYPRDPRQLTIESSALETWTPVAAGASESSAGGDAGVPGAGDPAAASATASVGSTANATPGVRNLALRVTLRNRARHPQPWPALELSLTDFSETVVARRVLLPSTYLPPQQLSDPIPAGEERSLRIPIDTTEARASGYRVAAFFP